MNKKDLSERDICTKFITPAVKKAGWDEMTQMREEVSFTKGRIIVRGKLVTRGKAKRADYIDTAPAPEDSRAREKTKEKALRVQAAGATRKVALDAFCAGNQWVKLFVAQHTFEVDFLEAGNGGKIVGVLNQVYTDAAAIADSRAELESPDIAVSGTRILTMANYFGKGWFAVLVGKTIDHHAIIPNYILNAVLFAHGSISTESVVNILSYRLSHIEKEQQFAKVATDDFRLKLDEFRRGVRDFDDIRWEMFAAFPDDEINDVLSKI